METQARQALTTGVLVVLFLSGLAYWAFFFRVREGGPSFEVADWPKEYRYYSVLQQAVEEARVPYFVSRPILETRKLLGLPEMTWSPQLVLLRVLPIGSFVAANAALLYAAGFWGLLRLRRRLRLSLLPFALLFVLFAFNGHITAHLAVGHSMWTGYFLLPFFFLLLLEKTGPASSTPSWPVGVALVLFAVLLQGSFHVFVWCVLFLALLAACHPRHLRAVAGAFVWTALLCACRLLPAALALEGRRQQDFLSGYPSPTVLLTALVRVVPIGHVREGGRFGQLDWWEYDIYVGWAALAWLIYFGLVRRWRDGRERPHRDLERPLALMALLAMDDLYYPIHAIGLPLLDSQRVSSRLLIVPVGLLIVLAALRTQESLDTSGGGPLPERRASLEAAPRRWIVQGSLGLALVASVFGFALHARAWSVPAVEARWPPAPHPRNLSIEPVPIEEGLQTPRDAWYVGGVRASAAVSLGALLAAALRLARDRKRRSLGQTAPVARAPA